MSDIDPLLVPGKIYVKLENFLRRAFPEMLPLSGSFSMDIRTRHSLLRPPPDLRSDSPRHSPRYLLLAQLWRRGGAHRQPQGGGSYNIIIHMV